MKKKMNVSMADVRAAVEHLLRTEYPMLRRPSGYKIGIYWYPKPEERRPCCEQVDETTRKFPYTLLLHCRTLQHCAALYDANERSARRVSRVLARASSRQLRAVLLAETPADVVAFLYREAKTLEEREIALQMSQLLEVPAEEVALVVLAWG